jgi:translocation and assembly module TamB
MAVKGEGTLPLDFTADDLVRPGPISLRAQASIPALEDVAVFLPPAYALTGTLGAEVDVTGSWKEPFVSLQIRGERLQLPPGTRFVPPGPHTLSGTLMWSKAEVRAEQVRLESPELSCSLSGAWSSPTPLRSLLSGAGGALTGSLSLRTSFNTPDIAWLRGSVEGLRGLRGSVSGEIAVEGPAVDPAVSGQILVEDAAFRYRDLPPVDRIAARVSAAGRTVHLGEISGEVGGSPFTLAGSLNFSRPEDPVLDLGLKGGNTLLYRAEGLLVRADSDLTLRGPVSALVLAGEVALTQGRYQKSLSIASFLGGSGKSSKAPKRSASGFAGISFPDPPLRDMRFDVRLTAREPFRILTGAVRGEARPDLHLTGTGLLPTLRGPIHLEAFQMMLPSGTLEFERGTVLFSEDDLGRSTLDLGGRMEARGYDITAQVGGTLYDPEIILSSVPPLPKEELVLFVLTGAPPSSAGGDGGSVSAMATPMAVYLGTNVLESMFGAGSRSPGAELQNRLELQIGREVTRSGSATLDARLLLKKNPVARRSALYLTGEKDVYDQENIGLRITFKFR